jgi:hypothetical protein
MGSAEGGGERFSFTALILKKTPHAKQEVPVFRHWIEAETEKGT